MAVSNTVEILEKVNSIAVITAKMEVQVADLYKEVKGNGKPGLLQRMNDLENCFEQHKIEQNKEREVQDGIKKEEKEKKNRKIDFTTKILLAIIGMILSNVGVLIFSLFK